MAEEEARGLVRRLRIRRDGGVTCEAVVDVCGFEDEMGETVDEVPEVEDSCGGGHRRCAGDPVPGQRTGGGGIEELPREES